MKNAAAVTGAAATGLLASAVDTSAHAEPVGQAISNVKPVIPSIAKNIVETDSGKVSGVLQEDGVFSFKSVPYGASTVGKNRFMPAQKPMPWPGVRSAYFWGWVCPQSLTVPTGRRAAWAHDDESYLFQFEDGQPSEDCLHINVWTPAINDHKKRPVLFWIHGGAYAWGSDHEMAAYDGANLAKRGDVVVCSINHRLGALGFLNLSEFGDPYADSMNVGMTDIVLSLEWVKTNIGNFGGDPDTVMIFGQSGGGSKVSTLMGMPSARGHFHRAVIQSSGSPVHQRTMEQSAALAAKTIKELGLSRSSIAKINDLPVDAIVEAGLRANSNGAAWAPVVDGRILPRHSWDPAAPEFSADVPLMIGTALQETANSVQMGDVSLEDMSLEEVKRRLNMQFRDRGDAIVKVFQDSNPHAKPFDIYCLTQALPRRIEALKIAALKAQRGAAPAYNYRFEWQTPVLDGRPRAFHCSELPFVFFNSQRCLSMTGGGPRPMALAAKIADAWIHFARNGNPNHPGLPRWSKFDPAKVPTMTFNDTCVATNDLDAAERHIIQLKSNAVARS